MTQVRSAAAQPLLSVNGLRVGFASRGGLVQAVRDVSFTVARGEVFAVIGESGSGKSTVAQALMGLLPPSATVEGNMRLDDLDLMALSKRERRRLSGEHMALVRQDALSALNPCTTVGYQIAETLMVHRGTTKAAAMAEAVRLLDLTGIPTAKVRVNQYPHEFSGGMRQRALIAMALALQPALLIADEPTTALDATIKAQILDLLLKLRAEFGMSIVLITHDMGVVARVANRMLVMYAGQGVETGEVGMVFERPAHPYTRSLLAAIPRLGVRADSLAAIPGQPPSPLSLPAGCPFHPRCSRAEELCAQQQPKPLILAEGQSALCHFQPEKRDVRILA
ncbi:ABC transporter ATP-binding protein [Variovorax sp. J22G21]|uniref:ABC transporter ATP-binding protein n=1 Tax=Variovorax fucosicus TaxID=3053517 RepID=UPI002576DA62|nr:MULTISPECIES: ABC transporter ATP-binding protein [unclassified Variovorax]MDM0040361.1 ABC transporter ATP-binding protein [Variovorax sp. J22R193]MDM0061734.1 ABC transporter ATP-binding protein [Variovorax sp. J22G21]